MRPPGIVPLELWDLQLRTGILWEHMDEDGLGEAVERLVAGRARTRSAHPLPTEVRGLRALWLAGGRAGSIDAPRLSRAIDRPVWVAPEPAAVAQRGARSLCPRARALAVVDLGQSHLKVFTPDARLHLPRPWDRIPMRDDDPRPEHEARRALHDWVCEGLRRAQAGPDAVVVALPCALGDGPTPGGSSYAGLEGDADFVPDLVAAAGWRPETTLVLNDAELAAAAARLDPRTRDTLTLVLTLGFGVGAALLSP